VRSRRRRSYRERYDALEPRCREAADRQYDNWRNDPNHPSVCFKPIVGATERGHQCYEARINRRYRAACYKDTSGAEDTYVWFWCGTHNEFDSRF
jgi:hypothetical protein